MGSGNKMNKNIVIYSGDYYFPLNYNIITNFLFNFIVTNHDLKVNDRRFTENVL